MSSLGEEKALIESWSQETPLVLDWTGDLGDEIRDFLTTYGLSDDITVSTITDRIRGLSQLGSLTEIMQRQCQRIQNSSLRLDDVFTSQICKTFLFTFG
jgi:hypothetical protein